MSYPEWKFATCLSLQSAFYPKEFSFYIIANILYLKSSQKIVFTVPASLYILICQPAKCSAQKTDHPQVSTEHFPVWQSFCAVSLIFNIHGNFSSNILTYMSMKLYVILNDKIYGIDYDIG